MSPNRKWDELSSNKWCYRTVEIRRIVLIFWMLIHIMRSIFIAVNYCSSIRTNSNKYCSSNFFEFPSCNHHIQRLTSIICRFEDFKNLWFCFNSSIHLRWFPKKWSCTCFLKYPMQNSCSTFRGRNFISATDFFAAIFEKSSFLTDSTGPSFQAIVKSHEHDNKLHLSKQLISRRRKLTILPRKFLSKQKVLRTTRSALWKFILWNIPLQILSALPREPGAVLHLESFTSSFLFPNPRPLVLRYCPTTSYYWSYTQNITVKCF